MNKEVLAERKERYIWEMIAVVLMWFMSVGSYGSATVLSVIIGMTAAKILGWIIIIALLWWGIYRFVGYIKLLRIEVDK